MKRKQRKDNDLFCAAWECLKDCVPCIPCICPLFTEIRGNCDTCNQQNWAICAYDLQKIPAELLV